MIERLTPSCSFVCSDSTVSSTGVSGSSPAKFTNRRLHAAPTWAARCEQLGDGRSKGIYQQKSSATVGRCTSERWQFNPAPVGAEKIGWPNLIYGEHFRDRRLPGPSGQPSLRHA
jgi:hypothetical protein